MTTTLLKIQVNIRQLTDRNVVSAGTKQNPCTVTIQQADNNEIRKKNPSLEITIVP
jgi:hypothetical protein